MVPRVATWPNPMALAEGVSAYGNADTPCLDKAFDGKALSFAHQSAHHFKREFTLPRLYPGKDVAVRHRLKPRDPRPDLGNASVEHGKAFKFFADALAGVPPLGVAGPGRAGERAIVTTAWSALRNFARFSSSRRSRSSAVSPLVTRRSTSSSASAGRAARYSTPRRPLAQQLPALGKDVLAGIEAVNLAAKLARLQRQF